ncbi:hypothetical protein [Streptomyces sp. LN245]|uniref:hypothetical protein n=1 Tax=Streptomyces sp. LN245 TaxID=3112975 RepID=UPI00372314C2
MRQASQTTQERTALYRLYDAEHDLLYIGISRKPDERFKAHDHTHPWWHLVKYVDLTWFECFTAASQAEKGAQLSERPPYNGMGHTGLGWDIPALRYDDTADRADIRQRLLAELKSGLHLPGKRLWPFSVSREYGYSRNSTHSAMGELAQKRFLEPSGRTFIVPARWAYAVRRRERSH